MSDGLPRGWESTTVGDIANVKRGASPRPIQDPLWWGGNVGWVRISDVTSSRKYLTKTTQYLSDAGVSKSVKIEKGEVVLSICATIGRPIIVKVDACIHDGFVWFDKLRSNIDREFWYYFLLSKEEFLSSQRQSGTQGNLNTGIVSDLICFIPPLPEQQKIAAILTAVDDVIESTQAKISKLKALKAGMMQELLTKGIGHTEFKDSEVGRLPKAWSVISLEDITLEHKQGYYSKDAYTSIGAYVVRITDLSNPYITFEGMPRMVMSEVDFNAYKIIKGDFLFARSGAIGRYGIFDSDNEAVFASYLIRFRFNQDKALNKFVGYCFESDYCQFQLRAITQGSSNVNINAQNIKGLLIPLPSLPEQEKIVAQISSLDATLIANTKKMNALQSTKKALMQDLLTGKVRVKVN